MLQLPYKVGHGSFIGKMHWVNLFYNFTRWIFNESSTVARCFVTWLSPTHLDHSLFFILKNFKHIEMQTFFRHHHDSCQREVSEFRIFTRHQSSLWKLPADQLTLAVSGKTEQNMSRKVIRHMKHEVFLAVVCLFLFLSCFVVFVSVEEFLKG